jgi:hypothetical protein
LLLATVWILTAAVPLHAQAPIAPTTAPQKIKYRRYFIPDTQKADLVRGYVPVHRDQLQQLLDESQRSQGLAPPRVELTKAQYVARFADGQLRDGFAFLDFQTNEEQPLSTILHPLNIALGQGVWLNDERSPAALGTGRDGQHRVIVPRSGQMLIPWSMHGEVSDEGGSAFPILLPSCPLNRLVIAVPQGSRPVASGALVTQWQGDRNLWRDFPEAAGFLDATNQGYSFWSVEFAGAGSIPVSIAAESELPAQRALVTAQQKSRYTLMPWRLELQTEINLDVHRHAISGINVSADRGLQVIDARLGDQPIDWVIETSASGTGDIYRLRFPQPVIGSNLTVRLVSHADLVADELWSLPRLRLVEGAAMK